MALSIIDQDSIQGAVTSSITLPSFAVTGTNRLLFVSGGSRGENLPTANATFNGEGLTELWDFNDGGFLSNYAYYKTNPTETTADIVLTLSTNADVIVLGAVLFNGVSLSDPIGAEQHTSGSSGTASITVTTAAGEIVIDNIMASATDITVGTNQVSQWEQGGTRTGGSSTQNGADGGEMTWTFATDEWTIGAVSIKPETVWTTTISGTTRIQVTNLSTIVGISSVLNGLQFSFPDQDASAGNWTETPLFEKVDESPHNDNDFISSPVNPNNEVSQLRLQSINTPDNRLNHRLRYRFKKSGTPSITLNFTVGLYDGDTLIAEQTHSDVSRDWIYGILSLSEAQANNITSYSNLRVRLTADTE